jgi:hypothetical protein
MDERHADFLPVGIVTFVLNVITIHEVPEPQSRKKRAVSEVD